MLRGGNGGCIGESVFAEELSRPGAAEELKMAGFGPLHAVQNGSAFGLTSVHRGQLQVEGDEGAVPAALDFACDAFGFIVPHMAHSR